MTNPISIITRNKDFFFSTLLMSLLIVGIWATLWNVKVMQAYGTEITKKNSETLKALLQRQEDIISIIDSVKKNQALLLEDIAGGEGRTLDHKAIMQKLDEIQKRIGD